MATNKPNAPDTLNSANGVKAMGQKFSQIKLPGRLLVGAARAEVIGVKVVDSDLMLSLKSGRNVLIKDGALRALEEDSYMLEFTDQADP